MVYLNSLKFHEQALEITSVTSTKLSKASTSTSFDTDCSTLDCNRRPVSTTLSTNKSQQ